MDNVDINTLYKYIEDNYGKEYVGAVKKSKKTENVQDAHEAIRPTYVDLTPEDIKDSLTKDQYKLYKLKSIITQNIDGLHTKAGNKNVYELHGTIYKNHCIKCNKFYNAKYVFNSKDIPSNIIVSLLG